MCYLRPSKDDIDGASHSYPHPSRPSATHFEESLWRRPKLNVSFLLPDIERLGNPGWNWAHLDRLIKKLEGCVLTPPPQSVTF